MKQIIATNGTVQKLYSYDELCTIFNYEPKTTKDANRTANAYCVYEINVYRGNDGAMGIVAEAFKRRPNSLKSDLARPTQEGTPKPDTRPIIDGKPVKAESKIGGGRIDDIKDEYIIYTLVCINSTGKKVIPPRLMKTETFINKLYELNAVKEINKNGVLDGHGIQKCKRALWNWLESIPPYDHSKKYTSDEII